MLQVDSVGTEGRLQNVAGTEGGKQVVHDTRDFLDMALCDQSMKFVCAIGSNGHQPAAAAAEPAAADCNRNRLHQPAESTTATAIATAKATEAET